MLRGASIGVEEVSIGAEEASIVNPHTLEAPFEALAHPRGMAGHMPGFHLNLVAVALLTPIGVARAVLSEGLPPVGAVYERTVALPIIGKQTVRLAIVSPHLASIKLLGALQLDEFLRYGSDATTGELLFELSERTILLLRRLGVALRTAEYLVRSDEAYVTVAPPLIRPIRIRLDRSMALEDRESLRLSRIRLAQIAAACHVA
jgi:hypothetical protein